MLYSSRNLGVVMRNNEMSEELEHKIGFIGVTEIWWNHHDHDWNVNIDNIWCWGTAEIKINVVG